MKRTIGWKKSFTVCWLLTASFVWATPSGPNPFLTSGISAYKGRRWIEAMDCFLRALSEDPKNEQAHLYMERISHQIDEERIAMVNEARMDMLARTAQRLEVARMDPKIIDRAIDESHQRDAREAAEQRHATCILAKKEASLGHLESANDLILGVIREDPNDAEAQRILSDLQSGLHESLNAKQNLSTARQLSLQGFYAYGQADYRSALASWKQVRIELAKSGTPAEVDRQVSSFHFDEYQKISQAYVDNETQKSQQQVLFEEGVALFERGNAAQALDRFQRIALVDQAYPQLARYLSDSQAAVEQERTRHLTSEQRSKSEYYLAQGLDLLEQRKWDGAKKAFTEMTKVDSTHPQAQSYLAVCRAQLEHRPDPAVSQQQYEAGLFSYAEGKPEEAARHWQAAKWLDAGNLKAVIALTKVKKEIELSQTEGL